ncbi:MAG: diaminopimelate decarboxylase [Acidobacteriota bacterium]
MHFINGILSVGTVPVTELIRNFGSPLYVYDAAVIRRQIDRVKSAFSSLPFRPFYAMKANDNLALLRMMFDAGFGCDCVSPGEVFIARHAGFAAERIWFTCSNVSDDDLLSLSDPNIVVNVNSMNEIDRVIRLGLPNPISIRVNPEVGAGHHRDVVTGGYGVKFGIDLAEVEAARLTAEAGGLEVVGLHAHIGSGVTEITPLAASANALMSLIADFPNLRWVNFGGGIGVPYSPGDGEFPIAEYGRSLAELAGGKLRSRGLTAILEPGRYLVAESGILLTRVTSLRVSNGVEWIGCDTGFNHLARPAKYGAYHHIVNASRGSDSDLRQNSSPETTPTHEAVVAGNLCESGDVFTRDSDGPVTRPIAATSVGDVLAICDAGAYGFSMASRYNARRLPAEVLVDQSEITLIREREPMQDLLRGQNLAQVATSEKP